MSTDFPEVPSTILKTAVEHTLRVLEDTQIPKQLAKYYDIAEDYVGYSFVSLEDNDPQRITSSDLMATSMLNIKFPASAVRRVLSRRHQTEISSKLQALPTTSLENTTAADFPAMTELYDTVKPLLADAYSQTSNRWVAASKLLARKRPDLFPVRDRVVCGYLELMSLKNYRKDWVVFRHLMQNETIQSHLAKLPVEIETAARGRSLDVDVEPLRLLDAALWMYAR